MKAPDWLHNIVKNPFSRPWAAVCRWHQRNMAALRVKEHFDARKAIELEIVKRKIEEAKRLIEQSEEEADAYFATMLCKKMKLETVRGKIKETVTDMPWYPGGYTPPVKLGGIGTCHYCGKTAYNLSLHESRCSVGLPEFEDAIDTTGLQSMIHADATDSGRSMRG